MLLICLNCDYEVDDLDCQEDFDIETQYPGKLKCPRCGDDIFKVYRTGDCVKSM